MDLTEHHKVVPGKYPLYHPNVPSLVYHREIIHIGTVNTYWNSQYTLEHSVNGMTSTHCDEESSSDIRGGGLIDKEVEWTFLQSLSFRYLTRLTYFKILPAT